VKEAKAVMAEQAEKSQAERQAEFQFELAVAVAVAQAVERVGFVRVVVTPRAAVVRAAE
jgi:hypothetical protein